MYTQRLLSLSVLAFGLIYAAPDKAKADPVNIALTTTIAGPPEQFQFTLQDALDGLAAIEVTMSTNATTVIPLFTVGTTSPVVVNSTKIDQTQPVDIGLLATDGGGTKTPFEFTDAPSSVPEPASVLLLGSGLLGIAMATRRRYRQR